MTDEQADAILVALNRLGKEFADVKRDVRDAVNYLHSAESEIPESIRRFLNYFHDLHDIKFVYEELGHAAPEWILRELERCDDRLRQLLKKHHTDGGTFEKVRREMAEDPENKWDHTRLLYAPKKETTDETRPSESERNGTEDGAEAEGGEPSGSGSTGPVRRL
jgi:hypothetical protein